MSDGAYPGSVEPLHDTGRRTFASDNYAGAHPEVIEAVRIANLGHVSSYGDDPYTAELQRRFAELLGEDTEAYPVWNGTGANVLALQSMVSRWGGVITPALAHINTDEGGAPEKVGGLKIVPVDVPDAKLTPELVRRHAGSRGVHTIVPEVVSITQSTEMGTLYSRRSARSPRPRTSWGSPCTSTGHASRTPSRLSAGRCARSFPVSTCSASAARRSARWGPRRSSC